ncbi:MAG: membrane protein insertion efficiency factor YidD [Phycisphaerales bacterium]|nr:membrane protein insertion efficiency factor YidD [Planctomycetota bacterium]MCH8509974.1 membrane protein insertion efficiency factor YidD [Phycisphaerales bacterium]
MRRVRAEPTPEPRVASDLGPLARLGNIPFVLLIRLYRVTLSPFIGGQCRYEPTCSRYGLEAYRLYGPVRGSLLTLRRILRCHPFVKGGYDPVPLPDDPPNDPAPPETGRSDP